MVAVHCDYLVQKVDLFAETINQLSKRNHVSIAWTPGHARVHGNEVAEYVAKSGFKLENT